MTLFSTEIIIWILVLSLNEAMFLRFGAQSFASIMQSRR